MSQLIGSTLGPYQVVLRIRSTHTNTIYKAFDTRSGEIVALQVILPGILRPASLLPRLQEHAKLLAGLSHPNIAEMVECEEYDGLLILAYRFTPSGVLRRRFKRNLTWVQAAQLLIPVAQSLAYAHRQDVIHGHLRPSSILLRQDGTPVLFDFGVETIIAEEMLAQMPGNWLGSDVSSYMAPEQVLGKGADHRSDIYSFGMVLYELVTGRRAFTGETAFAEIIQQYVTPLVSPKKLIKNFPETASQILEKTLAADPQRRFQDMQYLNALLARIVLDQRVDPRMIRDPNWRPRKPLSLTARLTIAISVVVLAALVGLLYFRLNPEQAKRIGIVFPTAPATVVSALPSPTLSPATATPTAYLPTATKESTATPTAAPTALPTRRTGVFQGLPMLANTPVPKTSGLISPDNATRVLSLTRLGIGQLNDISWSSTDGSRMALATTTGVYVVDVSPGSEQQEVALYINTGSMVYSTAFSPDSTRLATGEHGLVRLWDTQTGLEVASLTGHLSHVRRVVFSPDGKLLASVSDDKTVRVWSVVDGTQRFSLESHVKEVTSAAFSPDGKILATAAGDQIVMLWNLSDGTLLRKISHFTTAFDLAFSADGKTILAGDGRFTVQHWDVETGTLLKPIHSINTAIRELKISPDGQNIAIADAFGQVKVIDMKGVVVFSGVNKNLPRPGGLSSDLPHRIAFSPDGKHVASGIWDDTVRIWNIETGQEVRTIDWFSDYVETLAVSPNSKYLAAQTIGKEVKVWNLPEAKLLYTLPGTLTTGDIFSSNSQMLAIKNSDSTLSIYSLEDGSLHYTFNGHRGITSISFSKDSRYLISGSFGNEHLWSLSSGQELVTETNFGYDGCRIIYDLKDNQLALATRFGYLDMLPSSVTRLCPVTRISWMLSMTFNTEGELFAAGGSSNLEIMNYHQGESSKQVMKELRNLTMEQLAIAPNEKVIAAVVYEANSQPPYTIRIWDAKTLLPLMTLMGHEGRITSLVFASDGAHLISSSVDGTIRIWGVQ